MLASVMRFALAAEVVLVLDTSFNLAYSALQPVMLYAVYTSSFFIPQTALLKHLAGSVRQQVITALASHTSIVI